MNRKERPVFITGVSSGIGKASAIYLMDRQIPVIGTVRHMDDSISLRNTYSELFQPILMDQTDKSQVDEAYQKVAKKYKDVGLRAIINNAGIAVSGPMQHVKEAYMRKQMDVNFFGLIRVTQTFLPLIGASASAKISPGRLINVSSVSGRLTRMMMGPYSASKHAVEAISDALRRELVIYNIPVSIIEPGPIDTQIWHKAKTEDQPYMNTDYAYILRKRDQVIAQNQNMAIPSEAVAKQVYHAITAKKPKTRYLVTGKKFLIWSLIHWVPTKWVDALFTMQAKRK